MANSITADEIREQFSQAMSAMYQQEVPQYGTLLELVADVNLAVLENNPQLHEKMVNADELARLNVERHGAIRVGTAQELATLRRMFAIMGMYPVSYYDLSQAGVPVHSTAFRPIDDASLARNPFRVFTSLLRLELIENEKQRGVALTPKGRQLYDDLLRNAGTGQDNLTHQMHLQETFRTFPDSEFLMRQQGLAWFRYRLTPSGEAHRQAIHPGDDPQPLIERGWVVAQPITYEDFLPVSAAGIFQSNLGNETQTRSHGNASREAFEQALGCPVLDEFQLYQEAEERSKRRCGLL